MNPVANLGNQRWSPDEDRRLWEMLQGGASRPACAEVFKRTEKGIESRVVILRKRYKDARPPSPREQEEQGCSLYDRWLTAMQFVADPKNKGCIERQRAYNTRHGKGTVP